MMNELNCFVSLNFGNAQNFSTTVTAAHTLAKPTGCRTGQTGSIFMVQSGGSGTMAYNADFKFIGGTDPTLSTDNGAVDRLDYSNDSTNMVTKGPLSNARYAALATGSPSYGYWGGGYNSGGEVSIVDRIDFANDTATASVKGPLTAAKRYAMGAGGQSNDLAN